MYCKKCKNYKIWRNFWQDQHGLCLCQSGFFLGYLPPRYLPLLRQTKFMFGATKTTEGTNLVPREKRPGDEVVKEPTFKQSTLVFLTSTRGNYVS